VHAFRKSVLVKPIRKRVRSTWQQLY